MTDRIKSAKKVFRQINELLVRALEGTEAERAAIIQTLVYVNEDLSDHITEFMQHVTKRETGSI